MKSSLLIDQLVEQDRIPFNDLQKLFEVALRKHCDATHILDIDIAGYGVHIKVVGDSLYSIVERAFNHLKIDLSSPPALTINIWDQSEAGVDYNFDSYSEGIKPNIFMRASEDGRFVCEERDIGVSWLDRRAHKIIACTKSTQLQYLDERARPLHKLLSTWLHDRGIQFIHSGLISHEGKGLLFVGNGGSGKSTSSISCLQAGIKYLGDDFIGLEMKKDGSFTGHGFFASCLLNVDHLKRFPELQRYAVPANYAYEDKSILYLSDAFAALLEQSTPINAIALPRVVNSDLTSFKPATKAEALLALAPSSVMFLPSPNVRALDKLAKLVDQVPCFWLLLGRNVDQVPDAVKQLVGEIKE